MKNPVLLIVAIAAGIIGSSMLVFVASSVSAPSPNAEGALYLYLFKENSDLRDSGMSGYYMLHKEMTGSIVEITEPSFEQVHYGIGKDGVYRNWMSGTRVERFDSVIMIISDSIIMPDGALLRQQDFSSDARFIYSPYFRATLLVENNGTVHVYNQDRYNNPNDLPPERMIGVVTLPVEEGDFEMINSNYDLLKQRIESYKPRQLASPLPTIVREQPEKLTGHLTLIAESDNAGSSISDDRLAVNDSSGVSIRLYHASNATNAAEIVAVSVSNPSENKSVELYQLAISGYLSMGGNDVQVQLLSAQIVADQYNALIPTTTRPIIILPGETITAYIEADSFDIDRYEASGCYYYSDLEQVKDSTENARNRYCLNAGQQG